MGVDDIFGSVTAWPVMAGVCLASGCVSAQEPKPAKPESKPAAKAAPLADEKAARTAAQRKMESSLVLALKKQRGEPPFDKQPSPPVALALLPDGRVLVDVDATVSQALLDHIQSLGGEVVSSFPALRAVRASVPLSRLETLAERDDVKSIAPAAAPDPPFGGNKSSTAGKEKTGGDPGSRSTPGQQAKHSKP